MNFAMIYYNNAIIIVSKRINLARVINQTVTHNFLKKNTLCMMSLTKITVFN